MSTRIASGKVDGVKTIVFIDQKDGEWIVVVDGGAKEFDTYTDEASADDRFDQIADKYGFEELFRKT